MKQNVFDVLMYLFDNYLAADGEFEPDQGRVEQDLVTAGFSASQIDKAFEWLEELDPSRASDPGSPAAGGTGMRLFTRQELGALEENCRGALLTLEQRGILDPASREVVIDRVMALEKDDVTLDELKWVILMVLFNRPGKRFEWEETENLVCAHMSNMLH